MTTAGMTIGQLAKAAGVGVETIRFYQRSGLLNRPARVGAYRRYGAADLTLLRYIRHAKALDLSLKDIAALKARLGQGSPFCGAVRQAVGHKLERIEEEIATLERLRLELHAFLSICAGRPAGAPCPTQVALAGGSL